MLRLMFAPSKDLPCCPPEAQLSPPSRQKSNANTSAKNSITPWLPASLWAPLLFAVSLAALACSAGGNSRSYRSPTNDYQPPPGGPGADELGANRQPPQDTMESSMSNDHLGRGWDTEDGKLKYDEELTPNNRPKKKDDDPNVWQPAGNED